MEEGVEAGCESFASCRRGTGLKWIPKSDDAVKPSRPVLGIDGRHGAVIGIGFGKDRDLPGRSRKNLPGAEKEERFGSEPCMEDWIEPGFGGGL